MKTTRPDPVPTASILIIEDDPQQLWLYQRALRHYRITSVATASAALARLAEARPDVILLDHILGNGEKGVDFLAPLSEAAAHVPIVIVSGTLNLEAQLKALQGPRRAHFV